MSKYLAIVVTVLLALGSTFAIAAPAGAIVLSAADLAADCNDDGVVNITVNTQYVGGSADIWGAELFPGRFFCAVNLRADGLNVSFVNVNLRAKGDVNFNVGQSSAFANTSVTVLNSTIDMDPGVYSGGFVSIKTGCCAGEPFEHDAKVTIVASRLRGTWVELGASPAYSANGRFILTGSTIESTGDEFPGLADIVIRSPGVGATNRILANRFIAPNGLEAVGGGGIGGLNWIIGNIFTGVGGPLGVVLHAGAGGTCTSFLNSPAVPCT